MSDDYEKKYFGLQSWAWIMLGILGFFFTVAFFNGPWPETLGLKDSVADKVDKAGDITSHLLNSINAGERDGFADCENHRGRGATFNVNGWDSGRYTDGYDDAYEGCEAGNRAYDQGLADGRDDCRYSHEKYGTAWKLSFDTGLVDSIDYDNGYERGYAGC